VSGLPAGYIYESEIIINKLGSCKMKSVYVFFIVLMMFAASFAFGQNPVAYYPFNGNAADFSGSGHDGTPVNVTPTVDRFGNNNSAYRFTGAESRITTNWEGILGSQPRSVSMWVKSEPNSDPLIHAMELIGGGGSCGATPGCNWNCTVHKADSSIFVTIGTVGAGKTFAAIYNDTLWHNYTWVLPDSNPPRLRDFKLYQDGILLESILVSENDSTIINTFSADPVSFGLYRGCRGSVDDVRIYNYALADSGIQSLYHEGGWPLSSPVAEWPMDESSGSVVGDISGNNHIGNAINTTIAGGILGNCRVFNGQNSEIDFGYNYDLHTPFSFSLWTKVNNPVGTPIIFANSGGEYSGFWFRAEHDSIHYDSPVKFHFSLHGDYGWMYGVFSQTVVEPGIWYHVAGVARADSELDLYVNGEYESSQTIPPGYNPHSIRQLKIGVDPNMNGVNFLDGSVDEVKLYDRALNAAEINALYHEAGWPPQYGAMAGIITSGGSPLSDAIVKIFRNDNQIGIDTSDVNGQYSLPNLPPGFYEIEASKIGYTTQTELHKEVIAGQTTIVDFSLYPSMTLPLSNINWVCWSHVLQNYVYPAPGVFEPDSEGLKIYGTGFRNGAYLLPSPISQYPIANKTFYFKWKANGGGNFMGVGPEIFTDSISRIFPYYPTNLTTHHSYWGSYVITQDMWYYTRFIIDSTTYTATTATGNYDNAGGTVVQTKTAPLDNDYRYFLFGIWDCYAGGAAYAILGDVHIESHLPQVGTISGLVAEKNGSTPIENALIKVSQSGAEIARDTTDINGQYSLPNLLPGFYNVEASKTGYLADTRRNIEVIAGQNSIVNFEFTQMIEIHLLPSTDSTSIGGQARYMLSLLNNDTLSCNFSVGLSGLDSSWYGLSRTIFHLISGQTSDDTISIHIPAQAGIQGDYPFDVSVYISVLDSTIIKSEVLRVVNDPIISPISPPDGMRTSSRDLDFSWYTSAICSTEVYLKPSDSSTFMVYPGVPERNHNVTVTGLARNHDYDWYLRSAADWGGASTSPVFHFHIDNGVVFSHTIYSASVSRDYNQRLGIDIMNTDTVYHSVYVETENQYQDLAINFVGDGSLDNQLLLNPSEVGICTLAVHTQDATLRDYSIPLKLTSINGADTIVDYSIANIHVNIPIINGTFEEISVDSGSLAKNYRFTNLGDPITDLNITASDSLDSHIYFEPQIAHGYILTGQSVDFKAIPVLTPADTNLILLMKANGQEIRFPSEQLTAITGSVSANFMDTSINRNANFAPPPGETIYLGHADNAYRCFHRNDAYCTNRPDITIPWRIPPMQVPQGAFFQIDLTPISGWNQRPHSIFVYINGHAIGSIENVIPNGTYSFAIDPSFLNISPNQVSINTVYIHTVHMNGGHYIVGTGLNICACLNSFDGYVSAESQEQANQRLLGLAGLIPSASNISVNINTPSENETLLLGQSATIRATVIADGNPGLNYPVTGTFNNLDNPLVLFDDGIHNDGVAGDGIYANSWIPAHQGPVSIDVRAGNCSVFGEAQTNVIVMGPTLMTLTVLSPPDGFNLEGQRATNLLVSAQDDFGISVPGSGMNYMTATFSCQPGLTLSLYDDGNHCDGQPNDGTYGGQWIPSPLDSGPCQITINANHSSLGDAQAQVSGLVACHVASYFTNGRLFDREHYDAWGFDNYDLHPYSPDFPSFQLFAEAFGLGVYIKPSAWAYYGFIKSQFPNGWAGACYGMAYTSQLIKDGFHHIQDSSWADHHSYPHDILLLNRTGFGCANYINKYMLYQYGALQFADYFAELTEENIYGPAWTVNRLYELFAQNISAALHLSWTVAESDHPANHDLTPISIEMSCHDPTTFIITAYDNRNRSTDYKFTVNVLTRQWQYNYPDGHTRYKDLFVVAPTMLQLVPPLIPSDPTPLIASDDSSIVVIGCPENNNVLVKSGSDSLGFTNNQIIEDIDLGTEYYPSVESTQFAAPPSYILHNRNLQTTIYADSSDSLRYNLFRPGMALTLNIDTTTAGAQYSINVDTSVVGFKFTSNSPILNGAGFELVKVNVSDENALNVKNFRVGEGDSLSAQVGNFGGGNDDNYRLVNYGASQTIDLKINCFQNGDHIFQTTGMRLDSLTAYTCIINSDSIDAAPMIVEVDHGIDGTIDDTLHLRNGQSPCYYITGDANNSHSFTGLDVTYSVRYFKGGPLPPYSCDCPPHGSWYISGDVNGSCSFTGLDVTYMVRYFKGGAGPIPCADCPPGGLLAPPVPREQPTPTVQPVLSPTLKVKPKAGSAE
jgi:hypothetical protein